MDYVLFFENRYNFVSFWIKPILNNKIETNS